MYISPSDKRSSIDESETDWNICFIFEKKTEKRLQSSMDTINADAKTSYEKLAGQIYKFQSPNRLSVNVRIKKLKNGKPLGQSSQCHQVMSMQQSIIKAAN